MTIIMTYMIVIILVIKISLSNVKSDYQSDFFFFKKEIVNIRKTSFTLNELMTFKGKILLH